MQEAATTEKLPEVRRAAAARCGAGGEAQPAADDRCSQLQTLVCELLEENQSLRVENEKLLARVAQLEQRSEQCERGLADASRWTGALL